MITHYHRPQRLEEALELLARPNARPLGGGTVLNRQREAVIEAVDLQALGLDKIHKVGEKLEIGATATLQALLESPHTPDALKTALKLEAPLNLRNVGTAAGALVACDGRSPFAAVMLALEAKVTVVSRRLSVVGEQSSVVSLGDLLPLREEQLHGKLITKVEIPLNVKLAFEYVARTPADRPIVCAALAQWTSGRTRLVIGGWGNSPAVAMDGRDATGLEPAARNAAHDATDDLASAEYRREAAVVLAKRCLEAMM
ncbi:MAG: FAD binding domain-containing protein [Anaerolineales bacterium]